MLTMVENKLSQIILSYLLEKYAYSLAIIDDNNESKQLILKFRNVTNVDELLDECNNNGITIGQGTLSSYVTDTIRRFCNPTTGKLEMHGRWNNDDFFVGEILRLNLKPYGHVEIIKIDYNRWWVTSTDADELKELNAVFFTSNEVMGSNTTLNIGGQTLNVESVDFIVATDCFRQLDKVVDPFFYRSSSPYDLNLEDILIIPLYEEIKRNQTVIEFDSWKKILLSAFNNGLNYKTVWYITNVIANQHNNMYKWS